MGSSFSEMTRSGAMMLQGDDDEAMRYRVLI